MRDERQHLQLFDLIARQWSAPAAVDQIVFNASQTCVAFACANGAIAIAATADKSAPDSRIRRALDTGQLSIQPRSGTYPGLKLADHTDGRSSAVATHGADNFLFGKTSGRMNTLTPGGLSVHLEPRASGTIVAVDARPGSDTVAYAVGSAVQVWTPGAPEVALALPDDATALRFSPDGASLAVAHGTGVRIWSVFDWSAPQSVALEAQPILLDWSRDGRRLAVCLGQDGLAVIDMATLDCVRRGSFPAPVTSAGFGYDLRTVVASGAYRVAAWELAGEQAQPIVTGKSGLVLVDAVVTSPDRNLVAVGYANGLLNLAEIGRTDEILLREDTGAGVSALCWSPNGRYLGVGGRDGSAALIEFPDSMFKS